MKRSALYRRAAKIIRDREEEFSCVAISLVGGYDDESDRARTEYCDLFAPGGRDGAWDERWGSSDATDCRVLALLFMAAIAEDEE